MWAVSAQRWYISREGLLCSICPLSWHEYSGSLITSAGHQHLMPLITLSVGLLLSVWDSCWASWALFIREGPGFSPAHQVWVPVKELLISPFLGPWLWPFSGKVLCNQPKVPGWFAMFDTFNQIPPRVHTVVHTVSTQWSILEGGSLCLFYR